MQHDSGDERLDLSKVMRLPPAAKQWASDVIHIRSDAATPSDAMGITTQPKEVEEVLRGAIQQPELASSEGIDQDLLDRMARLGAPWKGVLEEFVKAAEGAAGMNQDLTRRLGD